MVRGLWSVSHILYHILAIYLICSYHISFVYISPVRIDKGCLLWIIGNVYEIQFAYDHVIKWKHFPRYWPFVRGIHWSPVNSPHKGPWRGALMFSLICALNKRLGKQSWGWWFETPSLSLWRHWNEHQISQRLVLNFHSPCFYVLISRGKYTQRTHDAIITSLLRQNDVMTLFWRFNGVIITQ